MNTLTKPNPQELTPREFRAFVIRNLQRAIQIMRNTPAEKVDLNSFKCGTTACLAGWLCEDPYFAQWMVLVPRYHEPFTDDKVRQLHRFALVRRTAELPAEAKQGRAEFEDLFGMGCAGLFASGEKGAGGKTEALERLYGQLEAVEAGLCGDETFQRRSLEQASC